MGAKENSNSLKRRPSKKSKKSSDHTDEQSKGELMKPSKDIDTGNMADDEEEKEKEKKKTSFKLDITKFGAIDVQKENETVPVKITSSFSCESLVSKPDITNDATKSPAKLQLAQERKQKTSSLNMSSSSYSLSIPDEEEIECLKEDTVTKIDSTKETKPAIAGLPMDDASEAWMIDDVGTMDSDSEEESEQKQEVYLVPVEEKPETPKETKPLIAGLPMDDASEAWMIDDVGNMDSASEEESEQKREVSVVEEPEQRKEVSAPLEKKPETPKETKPLIAGLPMDDASEDWMIDDVGTMD